MSDGVSKNTRNLLRVIEHYGVDRVIDVGANRGQYGRRLRSAGYAGPITSIEPLSAAHDELSAAAAGDRNWRVLPPMAIGATDGTVHLNVSPHSDMSSALPFTDEMADLLDSAAFKGTVEVAMHRLDTVAAGDDERLMIKIDTQGTEPDVIAGATAIMDRIVLFQIELSIVPVYQGERDYRTVIADLDALGFAPVLFIPGYFNRRTARLIGMDGVFARR